MQPDHLDGSSHFFSRKYSFMLCRTETLYLVIPLQYTMLKPLADRVLVKIKSSEEKTTGGILLPTTAQSRPQGGEVVAVGEGRTIGDKKVDISIQVYCSIVLCRWIFWGN